MKLISAVALLLGGGFFFYLTCRVALFHLDQFSTTGLLFLAGTSFSVGHYLEKKFRALSPWGAAMLSWLTLWIGLDPVGPTLFFIPAGFLSHGLLYARWKMTLTLLPRAGIFMCLPVCLSVFLPFGRFWQPICFLSGLLFSSQLIWILLEKVSEPCHLISQPSQ